MSKSLKLTVFFLFLSVVSVGVYNNCGRFNAFDISHLTENSLVAGSKVEGATMRRLSISEIDRTLTIILGETERVAAQYLPSDSLSPFDKPHIIPYP